MTHQPCPSDAPGDTPTPGDALDQVQQSSPLPIPIARMVDCTVTPYLSNAELHAILDDEDLAQYQRVLGGKTGQ